MHAAELQASPVYIYARLLHAVIIVVKIAISTTLQDGLLHSVMSLADTKAEAYLQKIVGKLTETATAGCQLAERFSTIVQATQNWAATLFCRGGHARDIDIETIVPLKYLEINQETSHGTEPSEGASLFTDRVREANQDELYEPISLESDFADFDSFLASLSELPPEIEG